ncbi:MAG: 50S ribosomal protein L22 [bacterium]|nr:50S ribosomal protein L22 [bacterium]
MQQEVKAQVKYLRIAPRKTRLLADVIRGLGVNEAEARLILAPQRSAGPLLKLLRSAMANAKNNFKIEPEKLFVKAISVDQGPKLKRYMPRARGSVSKIEKKTSHVNLTLGVNEQKRNWRFKIETPVKAKKAEHKHVHDEKEKKTKSAGEDILKKNPSTRGSSGGVFKKMFSRKSV